MKIAIDVDGTIANSSEYEIAHGWQFLKRKNTNFEMQLPANTNDAFLTFNFSDQQGREFYKRHRGAVMKQELIYPKPYVKESFEKLLEMGHEIVILTLRSDANWNGDSKAETEKWLNRFDIPFSKCVANCAEKGQFCKENNIDLLIEDTPEKVKQANSLEIKTMLILADYNKDYSHKLNTFACCWPEVIFKLTGEFLEENDI